METLLIAQAPASGGFGGYGFLIQLAAIFAIIWVLFIVPQRREQKRHRALLASLKPGDQVVTTGGVIGEVIFIREDQVTLKTGDARIVVERARITRSLVAPVDTK